jgi:hypothetical protein
MNHGRGLRRDMSFRALGGGKRHIEPVVLVNATRARLHIERGKTWMVWILVERPADMERVTGILAPEIGAAVTIGGKGELELTRREPAPCA